MSTHPVSTGFSAVVKPRNSELLYNEDPGVTNDILQPRNRKMYGKLPRSVTNPLLERIHLASGLALRYIGVPLYESPVVVRCVFTKR